MESEQNVAIKCKDMDEMLYLHHEIQESKNLLNGVQQ